MTNKKELPDLLLSKLNEAIEVSPKAAFNVIRGQFHDASISDIRPLISEYGTLLALFQFNSDEDKKEEVRDLFACAIMSDQRRQESEHKNLDSLKRHCITAAYLEDNAHFLDRELYLMVKEAMFAPDTMSNKVTSYFKHFVPYLTEADFIEVWERFVVDDTRRWMFWSFIPKAIENEIVPERMLREAFSKVTFKYLNEATRNKHAALAVDIHFGNYKHINDENRALLADKINYFEKPLMIAFHPSRESLTASDWHTMIEKDMRVLRHVPYALLRDGTLFSDDYLLELLERNAQRYSRYRLIRFLEEIAPERLTESFCNQIRQRGLPEQNHPILVSMNK